MESKALEIMKSILELVKERDALRKELESTKKQLDFVSSARKEKNIPKLFNPCVICGKREAIEGMVCADCERRAEKL